MSTCIQAQHNQTAPFIKTDTQNTDMAAEDTADARGETAGPQAEIPQRSRYLTRSATRKGTANISHILQRLPATTRPTRTKTSTTPASLNAQPKTRTPFIEALNRVASSSTSAETSARPENLGPLHASPAKPLPQNRKRSSGGMAFSPRGTENSPNTRPRKVARMPRIVGIGPSPLKPLAKPTMRSDALFGTLTKIEPRPIQDTETAFSAGNNNAAVVPDLFSPAKVSNAQVPTKASVPPVTATSKPTLFSPAKVPVGSQTPFRYGTNRILDVPLSAVKKGGRWSLASDLSDDSLLLAASPKKTTDRPKTSLSSISPDQRNNDGHSMDETTKDMELLFLREESADDIRVGLNDEVEKPRMPTAMQKVAEKRKTVPQKTSTARIVQRAQKSLALPRTTSSYANPTRSSTNAASVTAAAIDARTSLKNAIREPFRKPLSTPATQIMPPPQTFARPCGIQSRPPTTSSNTASSIPQASTSSQSTITTQSPTKPRSYIPVSPVRERSANVPNESHKTSDIGLGRPAPVNNARRKSLTMETSKSLYGLSAALAKLTVKRPSLEGKPPVESTTFAQPTKSSLARAEAQPIAGPSKPVAISRIPQSSSVYGRSLAGTLARGSLDAKSLGQSVASSLKASAPLQNNTLKGVTAFVDVRTAEGDDTSAVFAEMLRSCGARVSHLLC